MGDHCLWHPVMAGAPTILSLFILVQKYKPLQFKAMWIAFKIPWETFNIVFYIFPCSTKDLLRWRADSEYVEELG
jgi:hypothetical protein